VNSATGFAGRIAKAFLRSKLTPLIVTTALILGLYAIIVTPREEEPQIIVPMMDVFVSHPGASAREVEDHVTKPMEKILREIDGVEYIYSMSRPGMSITTVRFYVGEDMEDSLVKLYNKLMSNFDRIPHGVSRPLVKLRSIDDVPILTLTLWSERYGGFELRKTAFEVAEEIKKDADVSEVKVIGGLRRQLRITVDPERLRAYGLSPLKIFRLLQQENFSLPAGSYPEAGTDVLVKTDGFIRNADDAANLVVSVRDGRPVLLGSVADITDGPEEPSDYVLMGFGPASAEKIQGLHNAVTISLAKKKGTNATLIAERVIEKVEHLKGYLIPEDVHVTVTRNYGETAREKSDELLEHMLIAAISVTVLIALALGIRESIVVGVAVPVTLALTILVNYMYGYTLNRVTLFALIFSIGILVDDAIVVVENIHRHFRMKGVSPEAAVAAVDEVGNPTILATFTVIAALMPMAFVSGLMGPYMRPIPVGASAAMILSLFIAFIISPWLSYIVLRRTSGKSREEKENRILEFFNHLYERNLRSLLGSGFKRLVALLLVLVLLGGSILLIYFRFVTVKMLPFDNKSELQVIIDMPEGSTLEHTAAVAREIGEYIGTVPEVTNYQIYAGTAAPFNFNGLVRHYFLRAGGNVADIQVNFVSKGRRKAQSHDIAKRIRPMIQRIGDRHDADIKIVEIPPGPPVLSTLVAEVYGPDFEGQIEAARRIKEIFESTEGVVDVDWYVEDTQDRVTYVVDRRKTALHGISATDVAQAINMTLGGAKAGLLHDSGSKEPVEIVLRAPLEGRAGIEKLNRIPIDTADGGIVPLAELVKVVRGVEDRSIYRKNLRRVVYVVGDVAGREESPVYAIMKMKKEIQNIELPGGYTIKQYNTVQPEREDRYAMKWDGEWHITYEVFRDLGLAFAAVMIIIYVMVVGWFRSFGTPLVIMAPIPLSLVGILPAHALMGAFFTATSMIGFIAGAGIVIRNSIILVDFIEQKLGEGLSLEEAVVQAGIIRFRPMLLTAAAVVVGSSVILFDPIFQGMAISLMAGEVASTLLSRTFVPVMYYIYRKRALSRAS
jgi:multidrug efflux pump subunit AcrB